ncbi:MAG: Trp biosynthesis-associated membrane protein [Mycobacteriales bacterium]
MDGKRGLIRSLFGVAIAGVLVLVASGRVWSTARVRIPGAAVTRVSVTGHAVEPSLPALGIALLALAAAVIAARGRLRRAVGVVVAAVGATTFAVAVSGRSAVSSALTSHEVGGLGVPAHGAANGWWLVAASGALVAVLVGVAVVVRGGSWAAMGRKYEAPQGGTPVPVAAESAQTTWDALDRGEDPTE